MDKSETSIKDLLSTVEVVSVSEYRSSPMINMDYDRCRVVLDLHLAEHYRLLRMFDQKIRKGGKAIEELQKR